MAHSYYIRRNRTRFWWDSEKEEVVRLNFGMDSSYELIGSQKILSEGYKIMQGNFKNKTVLEYTGAPPHTKYTFFTDASCEVELMGQTNEALWGITEKNSSYK